MRHRGHKTVMDMSHHSLNNRILWHDGTITISASDIEKFIQYAENGSVYVDELTTEIKQYNKFASKDSKVRLRTESKDIVPEWNLPLSILSIDLESILNQRLIDVALEQDLSDTEIKDRVDRVAHEFKEYQEFDLMPVLHAIFFIINSFEENNIVWGVGRGSSVSSYILYLMRVHDVDSVKYELDFSEFMR